MSINFQNKRKIGFFGEELASNFLLSKGYKIVKRNFFTKFGEIDIVALKDKKLFFFEVKLRSRTSLKFLSFENLISEEKVEKMYSALELFMLKNKKFENYEFDIGLIGITTNLLKAVKIELIKF